MYYAYIKDRSLWVCESVSGAPWWVVSLADNMTNYGVNGNTLFVNYSNYSEVYDIENRSRVR